MQNANKKKVLLYLEFFLFAILLSSLSLGVSYLNLTPTKDNYVQAGTSNINYGTRPTLELRESISTTRERIYLNFLINSSLGNVNSAKVCLFSSTGATNNGSLYYLHDNWRNLTDGTIANETQQSWNNQPCGIAFDNTTNCNLTSLMTKNLTLGWNCWNFSNSLAQSYANKNLSFLIKTPELVLNAIDILSSRENLTNKPYLEIAYETPENITSTFMSQVPADLNSVNLFSIPLQINYSITNLSVNLNLSSVFLYYKTNNTLSDNSQFTNGNSSFGFQKVNYSRSDGTLFNFRISENQIYPATYNFNEREMETTFHSIFNLMGTSEIFKTRFLNFSNSSQYNQLEFMANTTGANPLSVYYCNSSYTSANLPTSTNCENIISVVAGTPFNHTHSNKSSHLLFSLPINVSNGKIGNIVVTSTSYFLLRGTTTVWRIYYISNISRGDTVQTSMNTGIAYSNFSGTTDMHIHQYSGNHTFFSFLSFCSDTGICQNTSTRSDLIDLAGLPPSTPLIISPTSNFYHGNLSISYTASISPNGYDISYYNISLLNIDNSFNKTINGNNSNNLGFIFDTDATIEDYYKIKVTACDTLNQCSTGFSDIFLIDNSPPFVSFYSPPNATIINSFQQNFSINISDSTNLSTINFTIYNQSGFLNETIINTNESSGFFSIIYNFISDGIYSWFFTVTDIAGNFFRTMQNILTVNTITPNLVIDYPQNNNIYGFTVRNLNYTVSDGLNCFYSVNKGITNISTTCGVDITTGINSSQGNNTWMVEAINSFGNSTIAYVNFTQDCSNQNSVIEMPSYPYVDVNSTFEIILTGFVSGSSEIKMNVTDLSNQQNSTFNFTYNPSSQSYVLDLIFPNITNYYFVIYGDSFCPTIADTEGVFLVRNPFYVSFCGFKSKDGTPYKNNFAYLTAEFTNSQFYDSTLERYLTPLLFDRSFKTQVFHTEYNNGCGTLKLYDNNQYAVRLFDGVTSFENTYSSPNISKYYGTAIYLGKFNLNGTNSSYNVLFEDKDIRPYTYLMNLVFVIAIVLSILISIILYFMFPEKPSVSIVFLFIIIIGVITLRILSWIWWF
jgi:hypothetical protein